MLLVSLFGNKLFAKRSLKNKNNWWNNLNNIIKGLLMASAYYIVLYVIGKNLTPGSQKVSFNYVTSCDEKPRQSWILRQKSRFHKKTFELYVIESQIALECIWLQFGHHNCILVEMGKLELAIRKYEKFVTPMTRWNWLRLCIW